MIVCCAVPKTLESVYASVKILHQHSHVGFDGPKDAPTFHLNYSTARKGNNNCVRVIEQSGTYSERERERERGVAVSIFYGNGHCVHFVHKRYIASFSLEEGLVTGYGI